MKKLLTLASVLMLAACGTVPASDRCGDDTNGMHAPAINGCGPVMVCW